MPRAVLIVSSQVRSVHSGVGTYAGMILAGLSELPPETVRITVATWRDEQDPDRFPRVGWLDLGPRPGYDPTPGQFWTLGRRVVPAIAESGQRFGVVHFLDAREGHAFVRSPMCDACEVLGTVHDDYAALVGWWPTHYVGQAADPLRRYLFHRWQRRLEKRTYRRFDQLMVNARVTGENICEAYDLDPGRLVPVTLTVPPEVRPYTPIELTGEPALLFSGGNFYRKGLDTCVRALPALRAEHPEVRLHVAGTCRSERHIRRLVAAEGVEDAVVFHGQLAPDEMAAMMSSASLFVMPSRTEALGLVYLEAFRAGVPVVAGDRGGVTEIVHDRYSGILVTPGSAQALADAILMLMQHRELCQSVVHGGREVLAARTPARLIHETLGVYGFDSGRRVEELVPGTVRHMVGAAESAVT